MGDALAGQGKYVESLEAYQEAIHQRGQVQEICRRAAGALRMAGEQEKADSLLRESINPVTGAPSYHGARRLSVLSGHDCPTGAVALSPDGLRGVSAGIEPGSTMKFWDLPKGACSLSVYTRGARPSCAAFSPCGRFVFSATDDGRLRLWDFDTKRSVLTLRHPKGEVFAVSFCGTSDRALSVSRNGTLCFWNFASGSLHRIFRHGPPMDLFACDPECTTGISSDYASWYLWDLRALEVASLAGPARPISATAVGPDGTLGLLAGRDPEIELWDLGTRQFVRRLKGHSDQVLSVAFHRDARTCVSISRDKTLRLWDYENGRCLLTQTDFAGNAAPLAVDGQGRFCLWGGWDKTVRYWDLGTPWPSTPLALSRIVSSEDSIEGERRMRHLTRRAADHLKASRWQEAGEIVQQARSVRGHERDADLMRMWNQCGTRGRRAALATGWRLRSLENPAPVTAATMSDDCRLLLAGDSEGGLRLWDVETGSLVRELRGHDSMVNSVAISPDREQAISGAGLVRGEDTTARLWDLQTGQQKRTFSLIQGVSAVAFSPDGRLVALGGREVLREAGLRVWDLESNRLLRQFEHAEPVTSVAFHPGGRLLVAGSEDASYILWDITTGQCVRVFFDHQELVSAVSFSPDGRYVLSSSVDEALLLRELASFEIVKAIKGPSPLSTAASSPDGRFLVTGDLDGALILWDAKTGEPIRTFEGHTRELTAAGFSPDGRLAFSTSSDHTINLWELDWRFEFPDPAGPLDGLQPHLENFLELYASRGGAARGPAARSWSEDDFQGLLERLPYAGLGWIPPDRVQHCLESMAGSVEVAAP